VWYFRQVSHNRVIMTKTLPRLQRFAANRFSAEGEYGLHLTIGVALLLAAMAVFAQLAGAVVAGAPITQFDADIANWLHLHARQGGLLRDVLLLITHIHSTPGILIMAFCAALWVYRSGHRYWTMAVIASVPGGMLLNVALKHTFERARPHFDEPIVTLTTYSFPSGHTMAATVLYGVLACYFARRAHTWPGRVLPFVLAALMIGAVAFSRMYLGAHYLTDILAALTEGCGWLAICISGTATLNRRRRARERRQSGATSPQDM
jgi:membrane-associated phospholipid phosphatase